MGVPQTHPPAIIRSPPGQVDLARKPSDVACDGKHNSSHVASHVTLDTANKDSLRDLVKSFTRNALHGESCGIVDTATGSCTTALYSIDRGLHKFFVQAETWDVEFTLAEIKDIFASEEQDVSPSPNGCVICWRDQRLHLLLPTAEATDVFCTSMKILRLYALQGADKIHNEAVLV